MIRGRIKFMCILGILIIIFCIIIFRLSAKGTDGVMKQVKIHRPFVLFCVILLL